MNPERLKLTIDSIAIEAQDIAVLRLFNANGAPAPNFSAGSHIDLHLDNGLTRSYSLLNPSEDGRVLTIAVQREPASRGGSVFVHDSLKAGDSIYASTPRNNFELNEQAPYSILIAGGIGVTPLIAMAHRLEQLNKPWRLYYCARNRHHALINRLPNAPQNIIFNFDQEPGSTLLDIKSVMDSADENTHFYCCGPISMMQAFLRSGGQKPPEFLHVEYFSAQQVQQAGPSRDFEVVLAKSGRTLTVGRDTTILEALIDDGFELSYSCMEGVCGSCETEVLEGEPDHRDLILSAADRKSGRTMMICCSGSKTPRLVLNL
ncbi:MAG: PDR/VanB family oxidoreductase [Pusillimonas sp.]